MDFIAADSPEALQEDTGVDLRAVSITWRGDSDAGRPVLELVNISEFEALGILRTAVKHMEKHCEQMFDSPFTEEEEEDDDEPDD